MPNNLTIGTTRVGDLHFFDADTPSVQATLHRSDGGIVVTVAWSEPRSRLAIWFLGEDGGGPPYEPPELRPGMPSRALFHDSHGSILLIGCRARGYHSNMFGPGSGTIYASAAILGVEDDHDFEQPHLLRTHVSGLREWLGVKSWDVRFQQADPGSPPVTISPSRAPAVEVGEVDGLSLVLEPNWAVEPSSSLDRIVLRELLHVTTHSDQPRPWNTHLQVHRALRDLLVISRWSDETVVEIAAVRNDDPLVALDNVDHGPQLREVVVKADVREPTERRHRPHLIRSDDLGVEGVRRWIQLRHEYRRALGPVITCKDLRGTTAHTMLAHTAPGLETLGYLLFRRDGVNASAARDTSLVERFDRILDDLQGCFPFDLSSWARNISTAYNALKHANRSAPGPVDVANAWRECVLVARAWVAVELGVAPSAVADRLSGDPQSSPFVKT